MVIIAGSYQPLPLENVPQFWVAYLGDPSDSGKIHSDVSVRWHKGEPDVINGMKKFAELTDQAKWDNTFNLITAVLWFEYWFCEQYRYHTVWMLPSKCFEPLKLGVKKLSMYSLGLG